MLKYLVYFHAVRIEEGVYKTNADLYGRWCFTTAFNISCIPKTLTALVKLYFLERLTISNK